MLLPVPVALMEVLRELQQQQYANPVGRTVFQKICYVVTEMGVPTGFSFNKGSYGPFSADVKLAQHDFANRNWLIEEPLSCMVVLRVGPGYEQDRRRFINEIEKYRKNILKTADLFSRIMSTEQAEVVVTVLYTSRQLKARATDEVTEQQIYDSTLDWKKSWNSTKKKQAVAEAIRNLILLDWMRAQISESMIEAA